MDDTSTDSPASPEPVESETENTTSDEADDSGRVWWPWVVVAAAVVAAAVTGFLYTQAVGDKDDAIAETATIQGNLDAANDRATDREKAIADLEDELETTNETLEASETEQARAVRLLSDTETALAEAQIELELAEEQIVVMTDLERAAFDFIRFFSTVGLGGAEGDCITIAMIDDLGSAALLDIITLVVQDPSASGNLALSAALLTAADECGLSLEDVGPDLGTGFDYGDNPVLDALWDECAVGDGLACDLLFSESAIGSEYERFGLTCGDRFTEENAPFECDGSI